MKSIFFVIYYNLTVDFMGHAVNAVSALHEWNKGKGPHDVITDRRKRLKVKDAFHAQIVAVIIQRDSLFCKSAISEFDI